MILYLLPTKSIIIENKNFLKLIYHSISTAQLRIRTKGEASQRRGGAAKETRPDPRDICIEDDFWTV